jgi:hypothetical protein
MSDSDWTSASIWAFKLWGFKTQAFQQHASSLGSGFPYLLLQGLCPPVVLCLANLGLQNPLLCICWAWTPQDLHQDNLDHHWVCPPWTTPPLGPAVALKNSRYFTLNFAPKWCWHLAAAQTWPVVIIYSPSVWAPCRCCCFKDFAPPRLHFSCIYPFLPSFQIHSFALAGLECCWLPLNHHGLHHPWDCHLGAWFRKGIGHLHQLYTMG